MEYVVSDSENTYGLTTEYDPQDLWSCTVGDEESMADSIYHTGEWNLERFALANTIMHLIDEPRFTIRFDGKAYEITFTDSLTNQIVYLRLTGEGLDLNYATENKLNVLEVALSRIVPDA
jgi:hypothetical protein